MKFNTLLALMFAAAPVIASASVVTTAPLARAHYYTTFESVNGHTWVGHLKQGPGKYHFEPAVPEKFDVYPGANSSYGVVLESRDQPEDFQYDFVFQDTETKETCTITMLDIDAPANPHTVIDNHWNARCYWDYDPSDARKVIYYLK